MLKSYQEQYANQNKQFVLLDRAGVVLDSDQKLFTVPVGSSMTDLHPFFESLPLDVSAADEALNFYCIHLNIGDSVYIVDLKVIAKKEGLLLIIEDLTAHYNAYQAITQKRNESVIRTELTVLKNLELQEREKFKNSFIQNFSHELRNPLTSIMAIIDILKDTPLEGEQLQMLQFLKESNTSLHLLLEDTLSIGMIDAGKLEIQQKLFGLRRLFELLQFTYSTKAKKKGLEFLATWDAKLPEFVEGDRLRLFQVLTNLLDNAIKYTETGSVTLALKLNQKRANTVNIRFEITDTGSGILKENQTLIFNSFHRLDSTKNAKGTGLGLTIVKRLLELMNSKVRLTSEKNKGSVFYFDMSLTYPLFQYETEKAQKEDKKAAKSSANTGKPKRKILLVEDDEQVQITLFKMLLNTKRFQIDLSYDGALVLQEVVKNNYDLILMDVNLPNINGIQLTKLIREFPFNNIKNIPIIGITANAYEESINECISAGMQKVLIKPFDKEKLLNTIDKHP